MANMRARFNQLTGTKPAVRPMPQRDTRVIPGYDDDQNSVRAEAQDMTLKRPPTLIPHLQDPANVIENLKKKRTPRLA